MKISEYFYLQFFLYQTFSYVKFQRSIRSELEYCHKTFEIEVLQK